MERARRVAPASHRVAALILARDGRVRLLAWGCGIGVFAGLRLPRRR